MTCGCTDNNKLKDNKNLDRYKLGLESMQYLSIDEIISLYRQGYTLDNISEIPNLNVLTYGTQCSGDNVITFNNTSQLLGTLGEVQKGTVWAQRFYGNFRCMEFVQFYMKRDNDVSFYIEIRNDDGIGEGKPLGVPVNDSGLIMRTSVISYSEIPTSWGWAYLQVAAILPTDAYYWICFVPVDFYDSPIYRDDPTDDRFGIQDGTNIADKRSAKFINGSWTNSSTFAFAIFKKPTFVVQCTSIANVSANPTTAFIGEPVFLTTQTSPAGQYTVEFYDTTTSAVLCSDVATTLQTGYSCEWTPTVAGIFQIKARVVGQCNSSSATQVTINCSPMVSGVTADPKTVQTGQQVTLTSMVVPSGAYTIQFIKTDGTVLASDTSSTPKMTYTAIWIPSVAGTYDIVAKTSIQPLYCANQPVESVTVNAPATCTGITLSANPTSGTTGVTINLTATTTPTIAGFSVTFKDGITTLGTGTTNSSGIATYAWDTTGQSTGSHSLTANVSTQCTSSPPTTVNLTAPAQPCTGITLSANPTSLQQGQSTTLTATVTNPPNTAGYNVDFKVDGYLVATRSTNSSGIATYSLNTSSLTVVSHNIVANVSTQCTSSTVTIEVTAPVQTAGGGGAMLIAVLAIGAYLLMKKPPTGMFKQ